MWALKGSSHIIIYPFLLFKSSTPVIPVPPQHSPVLTMSLQSSLYSFTAAGSHLSKTLSKPNPVRMKYSSPRLHRWFIEVCGIKGHQPWGLHAIQAITYSCFGQSSPGPLCAEWVWEGHYDHPD